MCWKDYWCDLALNEGQILGVAISMEWMYIWVIVVTLYLVVEAITPLYNLLLLLILLVRL